MIKKFFKKIYKFIDKYIVVPISRAIYYLSKKYKKNQGKLDKILNKPNFLIYLSLVIAVILFLLIDTKVITLVETEAEVITNVPVVVKYNEEAYVVEGAPETVDITLTGRKSDIYLAKQNNISRAKAQNLIQSGKVLIDGKVTIKPAVIVDDKNSVKVILEDEYVSRGAYKLLKAADFFEIDFQNRVVIDVGASTGGFSEVALKRGAKKVYAVDVGEGQLDERLVRNNKVINIEKTDIRNLQREMVADCDLVVGDISFISLQKILPHIKKLFDNIEMVLLFKPQFECGKDIAKKYRGVIKDSKVHERLLRDFVSFLSSLEYTLSNLTFSPIKGKNGNIEYLVYINGKQNKNYDIKQIVQEAFSL